MSKKDKEVILKEDFTPENHQFFNALREEMMESLEQIEQYCFQTNNFIFHPGMGMLASAATKIISDTELKYIHDILCLRAKEINPDFDHENEDIAFEVNRSINRFLSIPMYMESTIFHRKKGKKKTPVHDILNKIIIVDVIEPACLRGLHAINLISIGIDYDKENISKRVVYYLEYIENGIIDNPTYDNLMKFDLLEHSLFDEMEFKQYNLNLPLEQEWVIGGLQKITQHLAAVYAQLEAKHLVEKEGYLLQ